MKALVFGFSTGKFGGIESFLMNMNEHMSKEMVFDYVVLDDDSHDSVHELRIHNKGGVIHYLPSFRKRPLSYINALYSFMRDNKEKYSLVYINLFSMVHILPALIAKINGIPVVLHAHNNYLAGGKIKHIIHAVNRFIFSGMKCTRLTNSDLSTVFMFGKKHLKDSVLIYNAIDASRFSFNDAVRDKVRAELGFTANHVYGFSGRIAYQKNPLFLMDIFFEISKLDEKAAFLVCGSGDLEEQVKLKAKEYNLNIIFTGNVTNVEDYYQAMDCFVLPSRFEGLGIVLIEAQCCGLPCVTSADVVPLAAKATNMLDYIPLADNAEEWAEICVNKVNCFSTERKIYSQIIAESNYNIDNEAKRLERILINC